MNGLILAGGPIGIMRACLDVVLPYMHDRKQFGRPIGEFETHAGQARRHVHRFERDPRLCLCGGEGLRLRSRVDEKGRRRRLFSSPPSARPTWLSKPFSVSAATAT